MAFSTSILAYSIEARSQHHVADVRGGCARYKIHVEMIDGDWQAGQVAGRDALDVARVESTGRRASLCRFSR